MSAPPEITPDDVRDLWRVLGVRYGFAPRPKGGDQLAETVGAWLSRAGFIAAADWRDRFATFLPLPRELGGPAVFLPFSPGEATDMWPLWSQLLVAVHETHHAWQYRQAPTEFVGLYLGSTADRANLEREARAAAETVRWHLWLDVADPGTATASLTTAYGCRLADAEVAAEDLRLDEVTIRAGGVLSPVAREVIDWWRRPVTSALATSPASPPEPPPAVPAAAPR